MTFFRHVFVGATALALVAPFCVSSEACAAPSATGICAASTPNASGSLKAAEHDYFIFTTLKRKPGIPLDRFHDYLVDVHGGLAARLPNMNNYWQNHLIYDQGSAWPRTKGIDYSFPEDEQFDANNPASYKDEATAKTYFTTVGKIFLKDEENIFSETVLYRILNGNMHVLVDAPRDRLGVVDPSAAKYLVLFRKADGASVADFRRYLLDTLSPAITSAKTVGEMHLFLFEPIYNATAVNASADNVLHAKIPEKQYQAALEISFPNHLAVSTAFASANYQSTLLDQPRFIRQMQVLTVARTYVMTSNGMTTTVGLRGSHAAQLIKDVGACNQLEDDVTAIFQPPYHSH